MCTVTFLPQENQGFILTSNRDEYKERKTLPPKFYKENNVEMLFPKDEVAGGTWIGVSDRNRLICVLNGGFEKHVRKPSYRKSRGLISKELLQSDAFESSILALELENVEPFTMVIIDWNSSDYSLYELVWDGTVKHFKNLQKTPHIWSSSSLYSKKNTLMRAEWFQDWLENNAVSHESILEFHRSENGDKEQAILMKRPYVETVSISSIVKTENEIDFNYKDLINSQDYRTTFKLQQR